MNDRITELWDKAAERDDIFQHARHEQFAELIVKECIALADDEAERFSNLDQEYCSMAMDNYRELIRKRFGVKE